MHVCLNDHFNYCSINYYTNCIQEANEEIKRLEGMAELSTQPLEVCNLYEQALAICRHHGFVNTASKILCKRASYAMKHDMLDDAINDADNCITADPDYLEVSLIKLCNDVVIMQ